ncbi:MAG: phage tail sheath subtilisin-like domain-containing protein, partial [Gammaproteobacteria bacterium]|nr:phage tail sheath subtilisin-like domain-containing protein [Gammaproteobacteria bacterium]
RSRGTVDADEIMRPEITGSTDIAYDPTVTAAASDGKGNFGITGTSTTQGDFTYSLSFDKTKKNYITRVLGRGADDGKTALFVEEIFDNMFADYYDAEQVRGINIDSLTNYDNDFDDYLEEYQPAVTPWVVSELRGSNLLRLFRLHTISDGNAANKQFKISIKNIKIADKEFDIEVRAYGDTDAKPVVLERFTRCTMDPTSNNFVAKRVGTLDGDYASRSSYVLVELEEESDTSDAFPAGFLGFPVRDYQTNGNTSVQGPSMDYKTTYGVFENKRKFYLGLSESKGIDQDFFDYKGVPEGDLTMWTGLTKGFHMDVDATGATIDNVEIVINNTGGTYSPVYEFDTGNAEFRTEADVEGTDYEKVYARKFTFAPYGGYDGWDVYRTERTNGDNYLINGTRGAAGLTSGTFANRALSNGDSGINSDYYAYLEAIWTFNNPEATNINVFATPGIDTFNNSNLVEETIEMVEQDRADSLYIVTTPDTDASGDVLLAEDVIDQLDGEFDSNYTATYWPWIQINDAENNVYIYVPPTRDVVRNIALTDNISFPWFAVAGVNRGDVQAIKARKKLTLAERDILYDGRVNPIATFASEGIKIWGNKTLQVKESALDRINVRRLLLQARKLISAVSIRLLFEQNDQVVRNQFLSLVNPILDNI